MVDFFKITGTLFTTQIKLKTMYLLQHYVIDWDKVKTQEDLITILKNLQLGFENPSEDLKKLCKFVNKSDDHEVTFD